VRLLLAALVASLVITILLSWRMRKERSARHIWKGFNSEPPDDLSGLELWSPDCYTAAGRRLYPWFVLSSVATLILTVIVVLTVFEV
jgi:hypothetical protein